MITPGLGLGPGSHGETSEGFVHQRNLVNFVLTAQSLWVGVKDGREEMGQMLANDGLA